MEAPESLARQKARLDRDDAEAFRVLVAAATRSGTAAVRPPRRIIVPSSHLDDSAAQ